MTRRKSDAGPRSRPKRRDDNGVSPPPGPHRPSAGNVLEVTAEGVRNNADAPPAEDPVTRVLREQPGRWVAWDGLRRTVLAVADSYADALRLATDAGEVDPEIDKAPGIHPAVAARPCRLLTDESPDVIEDVRDLIPDADEWLDTPNTRP